MTRILCVLCTALALLSSCQDSRLKLCDITQSDCQQDIYYADLRLRGDGYDPFGGIPPIRTISEQQYRDELNSDAASSSPTPPYWTATLALLGLAPLELDTASIDNQVQNTAAYYSPTDQAVTVIAHPSQSTDPSVQFADKIAQTCTDARTFDKCAERVVAQEKAKAQFNNMDTLAHELVHALQNSELNLKQEPNSTDGYFARKALIEGDASLSDFLFAVSLSDDLLARGNPPLTITNRDPLAYFSRWRDASMSDQGDGNFASIAPPFFAAQWLVYPLGGAWLADRWNKGGNAAVRHAYGKAPDRSLDFLLGPGSTPPPETDIACQPKVPTGFKAKGADTFGAIELFAYLMAWKVSSADAVAGALLWRNDVIFVAYNETNKKTAAMWRIELAGPLSPSLLAAITNTDGPRVQQTDSTLLITASDDPEIMATWNPSATCP